MLAPIFEIDPANSARNASDLVDGLIADWLDNNLVADPMAECATNGEDIGSDCNTYMKADSSLKLALSKANTTAAIAFNDARAGFTMAVETYRQALASAQMDLDLAYHNAANSYQDEVDADHHDGSMTRSENLRSIRKVAGANALQAYAAVVESATNALAAEAGSLINAYAGFLASNLSAPLAHESGVAAAQQSFWSSVEAKRDATPE